jgi:hypothetical protein
VLGFSKTRLTDKELKKLAQEQEATKKLRTLSTKCTHIKKWQVRVT